MDIVIDTSAVIAVIVGEPERERIIELTAGNTLIGPGSIPWEMGNAFSAMSKRERITLEAARKGIEIFETIPIRYISPDFMAVLDISKRMSCYAYDAYFLECAARLRVPLMTLDKTLERAARQMDIQTLEI